MKILRNYNFWTVIIAAGALFLSQLPPLAQVFKGEKINTTVYNKISISHYMGALTVEYPLSLHNPGGEAVFVSKIFCIIEGEDGRKRTLPSNVYFSSQSLNPMMPVQIMFNGILLKPDEFWSEYFGFFEDIDPELTEEGIDIMSGVENYLYRKTIEYNQMGIAQNSAGMPTIEITPEYVERAKKLFNKTFRLKPGKHNMYVVVLSGQDRIHEIKGFEFEINEHHIDTLESHLENYRYGHGIATFFRGANPKIIVRLTPMSGAEMKKHDSDVRKHMQAYLKKSDE